MSKAATKALIDEKITGNGVQAITGPILNNVLNTMVDDYGTQDEVSQLGQEVAEKVGGEFTPTLSLEQGAISSSDGSETQVGTRIRTAGYIAANKIKITFISGNKAFVHGYKNNGSYVGGQGWLTTSQEVSISGADKYRIVFAFSDDSGISPSDFASLNISISTVLNGELPGKIADIEERVDSIEQESNTNKGDLDNLVARRFVTASATTFNYNFIEGKKYFIESKGSSDVVVTIQDSEGQAISGYQYTCRQNTIRSITAPSGAAKVRVGDAAELIISVNDRTNDLSIEGLYFDGYITTNKVVGETVDIEDISLTTGWKHSIIEVSKFDSIEIAGEGGSSPAAYCFVDYNYKVVLTPATPTYNSQLISPCDGFCIVNSNGTIKLIRHTLNTIERINRDLQPVEFSSSAATFFPYRFVRGEKYVLTCLTKLRGVTAPAQTTFSIRLYNNISATAYNTKSLWCFGEQYIFVADADANYIRTGEATVIQVEKYDSYVRRVKDLEDKLFNYGEQCAAVDFDFDNSFINPTTDLTGVDFTQSDIMEQIYSKFDSLVSSYPSYVAKVDAASSGEANIPYPDYANLNGEASGDYEATPTYKTYMYKLISTETKANQRLKKKKILIVGATHGNEVAAPFNLYLFAKNLCTSEIADYFKLRGAFDIYILPCLNGYGMYHNQRYNANGVDINRNFPIANWSSATSVTDKGESAGDQFETQLIMALVNKYNFDVLIDHHNYGMQDSQFYVDTSYVRFLPLTYKCLVDCSQAFVKNLPAYFGNKYKLFYNIDQSAPYGTQSAQLGFMTRWGFEKGLPFACTLEIGQKIEYSDGSYSPSANDSYTADAFAVGEFTLRNEICRYCGMIIGNTY